MARLLVEVTCKRFLRPWVVAATRAFRPSVPVWGPFSLRFVSSCSSHSVASSHFETCDCASSAVTSIASDSGKLASNCTTRSSSNMGWLITASSSKISVIVLMCAFTDARASGRRVFFAIIVIYLPTSSSGIALPTLFRQLWGLQGPRTDRAMRVPPLAPPMPMHDLSLSCISFRLLHYRHLELLLCLLQCPTDWLW